MAEFLIHGGKELSGEVIIAGSKNSVFPCIAASLLTDGEVVLKKVPVISDVEAMLEIVGRLGATATFDTKTRVLRISGRGISTHVVPDELGKKFRASILFAGALLGRMKKVTLPYPGGDKLGVRTLSPHFSAMRALGATVQEDREIVIDGGNMKNGIVFLEEPSVTATENTIISAVLIPGKTEIHLAAVEPHVQELVMMLNKMGAKISWIDIGVLSIEGVPKLVGTTFELNPDDLEVSGFAALAAATNSEILLKGIDFRYIDAVLMQIKKMGVEYEIQSDNLLIKRPSKKGYKAFRIQSGLYPKLMSDHIPPFAVLATQAEGTSMIHEWMYEGRLKYVEELRKMGAKTEMLDPHRALITGPTPLKATHMISYDIRAGLTVVIAALVAGGETRISDIEHIERGYEYFEERLVQIGADIRKI